MRSSVVAGILLCVSASGILSSLLINSNLWHTDRTAHALVHNVADFVTPFVLMLGASK